MRTSGRRGIRITLSHYRFMHDRATRLKPDTRLASLLENTSTKRESSTGDFHFIDYQTIQYVWVRVWGPEPKGYRIESKTEPTDTDK